MTPTIQAYINSMPDQRVKRPLTEIFSRALLPNGVDTAITATAGGVQATAKPLKPNVSFHEVTTCATAADAIKLPPAMVGEYHFVKNSGAASMQVFGAGTDTIDSVATATGVAQLNGDAVLYACLVKGNYIRMGGVQTTEVFTTITATTGNITTVNATTVDTTNIEVTTIKAKDGTAAGSIADSTGVVTLTSAAGTTLAYTNIDAGASGAAGTVDVFPTTASKGKLIISAVANDADTNVTITNAAMGQASVISFPDPGAATANVLLTSAANDGAVVTATSVELNYNDITTLGTLAASKAWTSDASLDTIMPTGGKLTVQSGGDITLESGSTLDVAGTFEIANVAMTASAAELNYNDIASLGTGAASKAVVLDAGEDYTWPDTGVLTIGVLATASEAAEHGAGAIGTAAVPTTKRWIERGGIIVTQTTFDLTGLASVATANDVIGLTAGGAAYIGRNVVATNGVIFKVELSCVETPLTGDNDVNVVANASATLIKDDAGGTTYLSNSGDLLVGQTIQNLVPGLTEGDYLYLTAGTGDTAGTYTAGMYILTTYGHAVLA